MATMVINWRLAELMARYRISGEELAKYLDISSNAVSNLKRADTMPRIDGEKLGAILDGLNLLAKKKEKDITPADLFEYQAPNESAKP
ncbi:helix-turn-helix transcriptional regulator [Okeania sp. KiyG1]|uniref:helix-turn-helix domain-containing protein n=1 Tax=Okeania sp. KiyG1 TaxID=2720165 RepID=UPI001920AC62|nr:helix-turn-helix transcriptional regulator [Okeania sp. KiyG1]GGA46314.1 hypothetical protein CYANOKiyG1_65330 [Okeania sp. KiyG1]